MRVDVTLRSPLERLVARQANNRAADVKSPIQKPRLAASGSSIDGISVGKADACIDAPVNLSSSGVAKIRDEPIEVVTASGEGEVEYAIGAIHRSPNAELLRCGIGRNE